MFAKGTWQANFFLIFVVEIIFRDGLLAPKFNPDESKNRSDDLEASLIGTFKLVPGNDNPQYHVSNCSVYFRNTLSVHFRMRRISMFARYDLVILPGYNIKVISNNYTVLLAVYWQPFFACVTQNTSGIFC